MMMESLCKRLRSVAGLVRQGVVLADIGTDHAYLPLFLLSEGRISRAVCTDVNEGPLKSARANAKACGLSDSITFLHTDGLAGVFAHAPSDVAICGMGGELIARILSSAPEAHRAGVRFLLQPMSRQEQLRASLWEMGFCITQECYVKEGDKPYVIFCCEYTGQRREADAVACFFGNRINTPDAPLTDAERAYYLKKEQALLRRQKGRQTGGEETLEEDAILHALKTILHEGELL